MAVTDLTSDGGHAEDVQGIAALTRASCNIIISFCTRVAVVRFVEDSANQLHELSRMCTSLRDGQRKGKL